MDPKAQIPAMNKIAGEQLYQYIKSRMDSEVQDLTAIYRENEHFLRIEDNLSYLLPTLFELPDYHKMRTDEYPFSFGTVTKPSKFTAEELVQNSLSVSLLTDTPLKARKLLLDPSIKKCFINDQTFTMDIAAPHEGFFTDFLYQTKATNWQIETI